MLIRSEVTGKYVLDLKDPAVGLALGTETRKQIVFTAALQTKSLPDRFFQTVDLQNAVTLSRITVLSFDAGDEYQAGSEPVENLATAGGSGTVPISDGAGGLTMAAPAGAAHKDTHKSGGSDAFFPADILDATIQRLVTTDGPTTLLMGAVADGELLKRSGTGIVSDVAPAGFFTDGAGVDAAIGKGATPPTAAGDNSFAQGHYTYTDVNGDNSFVLGNECFCKAANSFALGRQAYVSAAGGSSFAQGSYVDAYGTYAFAQGKNIIASGSSSFGQGEFNTVAQDRAFGQGRRVVTSREDQKAWGSNRSIAGSQFSHMAKHLQTGDDTPATLIDLTLEEDRSYVIWVHVVARNTTTDAETASFFLNQATAYRDTAGAAVLVGSPTFTKENTTGGPAGGAFTVAISASSNSILIQVTGEPGAEVQTYEWTGTIMFTESSG
jgi:hypothetical protein